MESIQVLRGKHRVPGELFGPLPGVRLGDVIAYEFELPQRFEPWPGRSRLERTFVLLDIGVSFANPCWARVRGADGATVEADPQGRDSWYVDLVTVTRVEDLYTIRDLYLDVEVPMDGRHARLLDLDEYADAIADGTLALAEAIDGLRRWQRFLDTYLHAAAVPVATWSDFPPQAIRVLAALDAPLGPPVHWHG